MHMHTCTPPRMQAMGFLHNQLSAGAAPRAAAEALLEECLSTGSATPASRDNITALVVRFEPAVGGEAL